ncbi:hypothetical protein FOXG_06299 [Fusarium oxysporum f. sp. lycopersici 4287]|nr:hypothetical protein FOXG_06299 [Fusarium oxysporum f. sp. lycopersici 4287]KNB04021.1 hypothetical protein FOXG_06299 [Fusarium oxysporum f. sp. lycopersici 4287]
MSPPDKTESHAPDRKSFNSLSSAEPQIPFEPNNKISSQDEKPQPLQGNQQESANDTKEDESSPKGPAFDKEAQENYKPKTLKFWLIILSVFAAMFLVALDRTIIATAIPQITNDFQSLGDIGWYGSAYMLTTAAFQLIFGRIYRFYPLRTTFLVCILLFEIGSAICGAAPNSVAFIIGRAIAGIGSAGIMTGSMMSIVPMIPLHKRPMFQSMFGMVFGISSVVGPLLGGAFTQHATWRWCFYMNLPVGFVASVFLFFFLHISPKKHEPVPVLKHITRLDPARNILLCAIHDLPHPGPSMGWLDLPLGQLANNSPLRSLRSYSLHFCSHTDQDARDCNCPRQGHHSEDYAGLCMDHAVCWWWYDDCRLLSPPVV